MIVAEPQEISVDRETSAAVAASACRVDAGTGSGRAPAWATGRAGSRGGHGAVGVAILLWVLALIGAPAAANAATRIAVFPVEFVDTSQEGETNGTRADETARLAMTAELLATLLTRSGRYEVVTMDPAAVAKVSGAILGCNGCELAVAASAGAEQEAIVMVQKVSNLIIDVTLYVRDVASGKAVMAATTSIRGNTDESWARGVRWLVERKLLASR